MKPMTAMTLAFCLGPLAQPALASADQDPENLANCKQETRRVLGEVSQLKLKSIARRSTGAYFKLRVVPVAGERQTVICLVDKTGQLSLFDSSGLSLQESVYEAGEALSLNN